LKQYIAAHSTRAIPVGYSAADVRDVLADTWNYLRCSMGDGDTTYIDMFGLNSYSWCGAAATYTTAGYDKLVAIFQGTDVPVFFSEYGCNQPAGQARVFNEVQALYGTQMTGLNGGLVYEFSEEESDYGLVTINADKTVQLRQDFVNLQGQYNKLDKTLLTTIPADNNNTKPVCDVGLLTSTNFYPNFTLPVQPPGAADLITNGVTGAINGKIVDVTTTTPKYAISDVNGNVIKGLTLKVIDSGSNLPSGANTTSGDPSGSSGSSSGSSGSSSSGSDSSSGSGTKQNAASPLEAQASLGLFAIALLTAVFSF
jgi:1,3-beta-glucanosyltransferase GAS3